VLLERAGGALVIILHYGLATSLLPLWLARASSTRPVPVFGYINNSGATAGVKAPTTRQSELRDSGFQGVDLDFSLLGELDVMRGALQNLKSGGIVSMSADNAPRKGAARHDIVCKIGWSSVVFAPGVKWLAHRAGVPVFPLLLHPQGDGSKLVSLGPFSAADMQRAVQALLEAAMRFDPAPWSRWSCAAPHMFQ
jgi:hypothetical protein